jgi:hypothetical protein
MPLITSREGPTVPIWDQFDGNSSESEIIDPVDYPAVSLPGYSEKPLNEQLEPIAVVGMGKENVSSYFFVFSSSSSFP